MIIAGENFKLRPFARGDSTALAAYCNNFKIAQNMRDTFPFPYTEKDASRFIENVLLCTPPLTHFVIEIENEAAGTFTILQKQDVYRYNAEIGYFLAEKHWGKNIMSKVIALMLDYTFMNFEINRVYAEVFSPNIPSMKTLEKSGFRREAILIQNVYKNGRLLDTHVYGILKDQWEKLREKSRVT